MCCAHVSSWRVIFLEIDSLFSPYSNDLFHTELVNFFFAEKFVQKNHVPVCFVAVVGVAV